MFNLEEKISAWRQQMLAAGIQSPVPLEELEIHLREDIERRLQSGSNTRQAFESAVGEIGRVQMLKNEFKKVGGVERNNQWERRIALLVLVGVIFPLAIYSLCKDEMSLTWRLLGFANLATVVWAMLGWRWINRAFPVIPNKHIRMTIGLSFGFVGMAGMIVFMNFILPHFEFTQGQLTVVVLWGLTLMAAFSVVLAGLEEAVKLKRAS